MHRLDLPEVGDLESCPEWLRSSMRGFLQVMFDRLGTYDGAAPVIAELLDQAGDDRIVDLASGAGGPWPRLWRKLSDAGVETRVMLTDLSPDRHRGIRLAAASGVTYHPAPVSALAVPEHLPGMRTMFTALHHFDRDEVRSILLAAQRDGVSFAAFEATRRSWHGLLAAAAVPLLVLLLMPAVMPRRPLPLLLTYLLPVLPLLIGWDGLASMLRSHRETELREIVAEIGTSGYEWDVGRIAVAGWPMLSVQYVAGRPGTTRAVREASRATGSDAHVRSTSV